MDRGREGEGVRKRERERERALREDLSEVTGGRRWVVGGGRDPLRLQNHRQEKGKGEVSAAPELREGTTRQSVLVERIRRGALLTQTATAGRGSETSAEIKKTLREELWECGPVELK